MQDAVPITLGQEFSAFAQQIKVIIFSFLFHY
jgi:fumarate hydratase class II